MDLEEVDDEDQISFNWEDSDDEDLPEFNLLNDDEIAEEAPTINSTPVDLGDGNESCQEEQEKTDDSVEDNVALVEEKQEVVVVNSSSDEEEDSDDRPSILTAALHDNGKYIGVIENILHVINNLYSRYRLTDNCEALEVNTAVEEQIKVFQSLNVNSETIRNSTSLGTPSNLLISTAQNSLSDEQENDEDIRLFSDEVEITLVNTSSLQKPAPRKNDQSKTTILNDSHNSMNFKVADANVPGIEAVASFTSQAVDLTGAETEIVIKKEVEDDIPEGFVRKSLGAMYPIKETIDLTCLSDSEADSEWELGEELVLESMREDMDSLVGDFADTILTDATETFSSTMLALEPQETDHNEPTYIEKLSTKTVEEEADQAIGEILNSINRTVINNKTPLKQQAEISNKELQTQANTPLNQQCSLHPAHAATQNLYKIVPLNVLHGTKNMQLCLTLSTAGNSSSVREHLQDEGCERASVNVATNEAPNTQATNCYAIHSTSDCKTSSLDEVVASTNDRIPQDCRYSAKCTADETPQMQTKEQHPLHLEYVAKSKDIALAAARNQPCCEAPVTCSFKNNNSATTNSSGNLCAHRVTGGKKFIKDLENVSYEQSAHHMNIETIRTDVPINSSISEASKTLMDAQMRKQYITNNTELFSISPNNETSHLHETECSELPEASTHPQPGISYTATEANTDMSSVATPHSSVQQPTGKKESTKLRKSDLNTKKTVTNKVQLDHTAIIQRYFSKTKVQFASFTENSLQKQTAPKIYSGLNLKNAKDNKAVITLSERTVQRKGDSVNVVDTQKKEVTVYHDGFGLKSYVVYQNHDPDIPDFSKLNWEEWQQILARKPTARQHKEIIVKKQISDAISPKSPSFRESPSFESRVADNLFGPQNHVINASLTECADTAPSMEFPDAAVASTTRSLPHFAVKTNGKRGFKKQSAAPDSPIRPRAKLKTSRKARTQDAEQNNFQESATSDWNPTPQVRQQKTRGRRKKRAAVRDMKLKKRGVMSSEIKNNELFIHLFDSKNDDNRQAISKVTRESETCNSDCVMKLVKVNVDEVSSQVVKAREQALFEKISELNALTKQLKLLLACGGGALQSQQANNPEGKSQQDMSVLFAKMDALTSEVQSMKQQWNTQMQKFMSLQEGACKKASKRKSAATSDRCLKRSRKLKVRDEATQAAELPNNACGSSLQGHNKTKDYA